MAGKKKFICSDESVNSYGFRVLTSGIDLSQFLKNPVMLFNHNRYGDDYTGPIGKWDNVAKEDGKLVAESIFDEQDEYALKIANKVENGFLRGASIGFQVIEESSDPALMLPGQIWPTITKCKLFEISVCDLPSNESGLALYDADGKRIELKEGNFKKLFKSLNNNQPPTPPKQTDMDKTFIALAMGLQESATESEVKAAFTKMLSDNRELVALRTENQTLKTAAEAQHTQLCERMVEVAISEKKIAPAQKEQYLKLFKADFDTTKGLLDGMPKAVKLTNEIPVGSGKQAPKGREAWNLTQWRKEDPEGLKQMQLSEPERFQALVDGLGVAPTTTDNEE